MWLLPAAGLRFGGTVTTRRAEASLLLPLIFLLVGASSEAAPTPPPKDAALHFEARSLLLPGGGLDVSRVSTCKSAACRANEVENSTAANSYCDVAPPLPEVAGAVGLCAAGCPRFLLDLSAHGGRRQTGGVSWDLGNDDAEKPCLVPDCVKPGVACLRGTLPLSGNPGEVWNTGASLEMQIPDIVTFPGDFWVALVLRKDPAQGDEMQCVFGDATRHFCVRSSGALRLRLGTGDFNLSAAGALPPEGFHLVEIWRSGAALAIAVDGKLETVGNPSSSTPLAMAYLMSYFKGGGAFAGDLALALFYQRAPSEAERRQLGLYVGDIFAVGPWANRFRPPR